MRSLRIAMLTNEIILIKWFDVFIRNDETSFGGAGGAANKFYDKLFTTLFGQMVLAGFHGGKLFEL